MSIDRLSIDDIKQLVNGEHDSQNKITIGYAGMESGSANRKREIGERWTDADGNEWEQKNGYRIKHGKFDELRKELSTFVNCRKEECTCTKPKRLDEKMRAKMGMCFDCVLDMEYELQLSGKYEEYERGKIKANAVSWLGEAKRDKDAIIDELSRLSFIQSSGQVETWDTSVSKEELAEKIENEFRQFENDFIAKLEKPNGEGKEESEAHTT